VAFVEPKACPVPGSPSRPVEGPPGACEGVVGVKYGEGAYLAGGAAGGATMAWAQKLLTCDGLAICQDTQVKKVGNHCEHACVNGLCVVVFLVNDKDIPWRIVVA
jgi:hypothetical protein